MFLSTVRKSKEKSGKVRKSQEKSGRIIRQDVYEPCNGNNRRQKWRGTKLAVLFHEAGSPGLVHSI